MKKLFILSIAVVFASACFGQAVEESAVPQAVKNMLQSRFASAKDVKWEKEDTLYSAEFIINDSKTEAEFNSSGKWLCTEWDIPVEYTPMSVKKYLDSAYTGYKIKELTYGDFADAGKLYVADISVKKECYEVFFTVMGEFSKSAKETACPDNRKTGNDKKKTK